MRSLLSSVCFLVLAACAAPQPVNTIAEFPFGESFSTPPGKMVMIGKKVTLSFMDVVEDSRCPTQVTCVWQGVAKVKVGVIIPDGAAIEHQDVILATTPDAARITTLKGYRIELINVTPWPESAGRIEPGKYAVDLRVTRDE